MQKIPGDPPSNPSGGGESDSVLMNRHPIYDSALDAIAYEPKAHVQLPGKRDGDTAGSVDPAIFLAAIAEHLDTLIGNRWGLVSLPPSVIRSGDYELLPAERVVVGVDEGPVDEELLAALGKLSDRGYRLALHFSDERFRSMAGPADILTLNLALERDAALAESFRPPGNRKAKVLVSGIDTHEDFDRSRELGADLFEGYFFCTPKKRGKAVPVTKLAVVRLLAALQSPEVRLQDLEDIIRYDVSLSYKLLSFVNSAYVGLSREVSSIKHAVNMVGIEHIRRWASLLLFASLEHKPRELVVTAAVRARMCERLADSHNDYRQSTFFTVGLLSVLDAMLDLPMAEALQGLSLSGEVSDALVLRSGPLGTTLRAVIAYEQGDWKRHALLRFRPSRLRDSYLDSLQWTRSVAGGLL